MMKGWTFLKIKDYPIQIIDGDRGTNYPTKEEFLQDGYCLFLNTGNVTLFGFNFDEKAFVTEEKHKKLRKGHLQRYDCVLTTRGTIGNVAFYGDSIPYDVVRINSGMLILRPDRSKLDPGFFYGLLRSSIFQQQAGLFRYGAAQPQLPITTLKHIRLPLPPLPIQQKIAGILSAYDDLIDNNLKRIKMLEEMAQITYEEWFVRLRFNGHESTSINPETSLPEGWRMGTMQDLFDFKNGYAFKSGTYVQDGQHKIVTIKNVQDGSFIPDTTDTIAELPSNIKAHHHLSTGDIIISLTGNVGRVCLVYGENYLLNQRVAKVVPNNPADRLYVYALLRSRGTLTQLANISNGAAQQNLSPVNASKMAALIPARSVLDDFNKSIGSIVDLICLKNIENSQLREARDILLPRLMTGVIDVEGYDPAQLLKEAA